MFPNKHWFGRPSQYAPVRASRVAAAQLQPAGHLQFLSRDSTPKTVTIDGINAMFNLVPSFTFETALDGTLLLPLRLLLSWGGMNPTGPDYLATLDDKCIKAIFG